MSSKSKQKRDKKILEDDNKCYICNNLAKSIDHQPPKSFFFNRHTPQEFIFSCCDDCNQNSRREDQIASILLTFPEASIFRSMSNHQQEHYIKKLQSAISNAKKTFL